MLVSRWGCFLFDVSEGGVIEEKRAIPSSSERPMNPKSVDSLRGIRPSLRGAAGSVAISDTGGEIASLRSQ